MNYELRAIKESDYKAVFEIERLSFIAPWKEEEFLSEIKDNPFANISVIVLDNKEIAGFYDYWVTFDSATIAQIAIHPSYRKQGLASIMLEEIIEDCYAKRVTNITLEVRDHNNAAIALYEKYGFKVVTVKEGYYTNGDNALYMVRKVNLNG